MMGMNMPPTLTANCGECGCDRSDFLRMGMVPAPGDRDDWAVFVLAKCKGCGNLFAITGFFCDSGHLHFAYAPTKMAIGLSAEAMENGIVRGPGDSVPVGEDGLHPEWFSDLPSLDRDDQS